MAEQPGELRIEMAIGRGSPVFAPTSSVQRPRRAAPYKALLSPRGASELMFEEFGAVCRRDALGEHFNFPQRWFPFPGVSMSTLFGNSPQTLSLALNLLDHYCLLGAGQDRLRSKPHPIARQLMKEFASEMLAPLAGCTWHLPIESVTHWVKGRSR
jgi:hypothetical protein